MSGRKKNQRSREKKAESTQKDQKTDKKESTEIPFDAWFGAKVSRKDLWIRDAVKKHMLSKGLKELEDKEKFDKAYESY